MTHESLAHEPQPYLSINNVCRRFAISRSTFYRLLADPDTGLEELVVRIPPRTGRLRVPAHAFEEWLRGRGDSARRRGRTNRPHSHDEPGQSIPA
ncbi:MAG: helix-turn-helix domain-containing protein [Planctomycetes bacterium]|nr:helix-turn-helix domain-containing protein [Planctomycetota bacterium]MCW8137428.1 helix-turn-helix domain-containing protein [Planctomycetota bacterium]